MQSSLPSFLPHATDDIAPSQKTQKFSFAPSARPKMVDFLYAAPKTCRLFEVSVILPPSGKISAGAHDLAEISGYYRTYSAKSSEYESNPIDDSLLKYRYFTSGSKDSMYLSCDSTVLLHETWEIFWLQQKSER